MSRRVVTIDLRRPYHKYRSPDGGVAFAKPTADSLLKRRKAKAQSAGRIVIRHKRDAY